MARFLCCPVSLPLVRSFFGSAATSRCIANTRIFQRAFSRAYRRYAVDQLLIDSNPIPSHLQRNHSKSHRRGMAHFLREKIVTRNLDHSIEASSLNRDLCIAINVVKRYDPSGYLPGMLLSTAEARLGYFTFRALWVETGLRFGFNILPEIRSKDKYDIRTAEGRLQFWSEGIESVFRLAIDPGGSESDDLWSSHPTLRLLKILYCTPSSLNENNILHTQQSRDILQSLLSARIHDLELTQYPTMQNLINRCHDSCSGLSSLVLECTGLHITTTNYAHQPAHQAARHFGVTHGIANALRMAIVSASSIVTSNKNIKKVEGSYNPVNTNTAGRIVLPQDLCEKYSLLRPRYVLSALATGDEDCKRKLKLVVKDMVDVARKEMALGEEQINEMGRLSTNDKKARLAKEVFLPVIASTTFLDRLEQRDYDLTDRGLRNASVTERFVCSLTMMRTWVKLAMRSKH